MLKSVLILPLIFCVFFAAEAQRLSKVNFNGQWKGGFRETTNPYSVTDDNDIVYVLELTTSGKNVSGYSYTYFNTYGKKYYTICRLVGTLDRVNNKIVVTEVERTKYNTPADFQNCFQTHVLHYEKDKDSDTEMLKGTWMPAPNQGRGCGSGVTVLSRRVVNRQPFGIKPQVVQKNKPVIIPPKKQTVVKPHKVSPPVVKKEPEPQPKILRPSDQIVQPAIKPSEKINSQNEITGTAPRVNGFDDRKKNVLKTISISQPVFQLDSYDNGEIDGDSISVFYNGKVVLSHKRLSDKPITLKLALNPDVKENVVTMYADNLGTIPPNTALMVVTDGDKRYEVRMESDLGKSGTVIFVHDK